MQLQIKMMVLVYLLVVLQVLALTQKVLKTLQLYYMDKALGLIGLMMQLQVHLVVLTVGEKIT